jgi:hypothetical protein
VLVGVAIAGLVAWFAGDKSVRAWAPNITIGAITSAVTVTIIDGAVRREARRRIMPRVENVRDRIVYQLERFLFAIVLDYAMRHVESFNPIPADTFEMLDQVLSQYGAGENRLPVGYSDMIAWVLQYQTEENRGGLPWILRRDAATGTTSLPEDEPPPLLITAACDFAKVLDSIRERDLDIIEPELVYAMDMFGLGVRLTQKFFDMSESRSTALEVITGHEIVSAVRDFALVFRKYASNGYAATWLEVPDIMRDTARGISEEMGDLLDEDTTEDVGD